MTQRNNLTIHPVPVSRRMLFGALIGLALISAFLLTAGEPNPSWGKFWRIKPLMIVPFAGAMGGVFYHYMDYLRYYGDWRKFLGIILGLLGFTVILWLGTVLGLNGTYWD